MYTEEEEEEEGRKHAPRIPPSRVKYLMIECNR